MHDGRVKGYNLTIDLSKIVIISHAANYYEKWRYTETDVHVIDLYLAKY